MYGYSLRSRAACTRDAAQFGGQLDGGGARLQARACSCRLQYAAIPASRRCADPTALLARTMEFT
jgi:hypothetical protein